jgi:hypothetical protein
VTISQLINPQLIESDFPSLHPSSNPPHLFSYYNNYFTSCSITAK